MKKFIVAVTAALAIGVFAIPSAANAAKKGSGGHHASHGGSGHHVSHGSGNRHVSHGAGRRGVANVGHRGRSWGGNRGGGYDYVGYDDCRHRGLSIFGLRLGQSCGYGYNYY